jgi:hypothetical protein
MWLIPEAQLALEHNSIKTTAGEKEKKGISADLEDMGNRCGSQRMEITADLKGRKSLRISKE